MNNQPLSEDHQFILAAQKDAHQFGVLYEKYYSKVFRFVYNKVGEKALTADLTSQVFLKAMLNIGKYEDRGIPFLVWLFRIAGNEVNMFFRQSKKPVSVAIDDILLRRIVLDSDMPANEPIMQAMIAALNELKPDDIQIIELRFFDDLSFKEIADFYQSKEATVKMRVYRILERLRKTIENSQNLQ